MAFPGTQTLPLVRPRRRADFSQGWACRRSGPRAEFRGAAQGPGRRPLTRSCTAPPISAWRWVEASKVDAIVVAGGDNGFNHLFVQPDIPRIADLRGPNAGRRCRQHRLVVRALRNPPAARPDPRRHHHPRGRRPVPPFRGDARRQDHGGGDPQSAVRDPRRRAGLKDMGAVVDTIGPYLGTVPYVLRAWAHANAGTLVGLPRGLHRGLALTLDPANKAEARKARRRPSERGGRHRGGNPCGGVRSGERPGQGCRLRSGRLRDRAQAPRRLRGRAAAPAEKYFDLSFHRQALAGL